MKLVILGATGLTGHRLVDQAIERGHEVVAYVRSPDALRGRPGLRVVGGQLTDEPALRSALTGADAVLCAIGPKGLRGLIGADLMQRTLPVVVEAMSGAGVRRLVLLSAYGVGDTAASASPIATIAFRTAVRSLYRDKQLAESRLATADVDVTTVYPLSLTNDPLSDTAVVRDVATVTRVSGLPKVPRANVAKAMLDAVEDPGTIGRRLIVSSAGTVR
ncbi:NAD(P)-binding oxidoreductase [Blastococcus sp. CT_GayMR16]|uniref:NAD(P)-dependent oxidoreductase n=1 Tax=Blastococcus sp. CT_GayMR16 TaxID=2559607 RepID=UPI00142F72AB|nr:NAD(P)-binding oxidoreductase [Blastococcus sp. CT_GayMR16]